MPPTIITPILRNASKLTTKIITTTPRNRTYQQAPTFYYSSSSCIIGPRHHTIIIPTRTTTTTACYPQRFISTNTIIKRRCSSSHIPSSDVQLLDEERKTTHDDDIPHDKTSSSSTATTTTSPKTLDDELTDPSHDDDNHQSPSLIPTCYVENGLDKHKLTPYTTGWAWQQIILHRRLDYQRRRKTTMMMEEEEDKLTNTNDSHATRNHHTNNKCTSSSFFENCDRLLFFEHSPVYTLGRGADEKNVTFLSSNDDDEEETVRRRRRLSRRSSRISGDGDEGSARLRWNAGDDVRVMTVDGLVDRLEHSIHPVTSPNGVPIYRVDRGGEVTFHGPGQLVCYPLVDLRQSPYRQDLHWYLRAVEEVIIRTLRFYGIEGTRDDENTGVWVDDRKIAAVGISSSRWITTHGFAINVSPDLSYFDTSLIIPCGIEGKGVTSMTEIMIEQQGMVEECPTVEDVARVTVASFESVFGVTTRRGDLLR